MNGSKQTKIGIAAFPILLYDFLTELKEYHKVEIPKSIVKELLVIAEKRIEELKKQDRLIKVTKPTKIKDFRGTKNPRDFSVYKK